MNDTTVQKRALTIAEFCERYSVGRTTTYGLMKSGALTIVKVGARTLIPVECAEAWFASLANDVA